MKHLLLIINKQIIEGIFDYEQDLGTSILPVYFVFSSHLWRRSTKQFSHWALKELKPKGPANSHVKTGGPCNKFAGTFIFTAQEQIPSIITGH